MRKIHTGISADQPPGIPLQVRKNQPCQPPPCLTVKTLEEQDFPKWDQFVMRHPFGSIFHTTSWMSVIRKTYGIEPHYVYLEKNRRMRACLPLFRIRSFITGDRVLCLPAASTCEPLTDGEALSKMMEFVQGRSDPEKWAPWEIRTSARFPVEIPFLSRQDLQFVTHLLNLEQPLKDIWASFHRGQVVRSIRKALRSGLKLEDCRDRREVSEFYRLYLKMRTHRGLLPQPLSFFQNLWDELSPQGRVQLSFARLGSRTVSAVFLLKYRDVVIYEYGATHPAALKARPSHLLLWRSIRMAHAEGYRWFDFGRTGVDNPSLLAFKDRWGTTQVPLVYYQAPGGTTVSNLRKKRFLPTAMNVLMRNSPDLFCRWLGDILYRHTL